MHARRAPNQTVNMQRYSHFSYQQPYGQQIQYPGNHQGYGQNPNQNPNQNQNQKFQPNSPQFQQTSTPFQQLAKPQQPVNWYQPSQQGPPNQNWKQQPKGIMSYFQDKNGQMDIDKMLGTVGQMANTYHQVSPILKGLGSFVKRFK
ncbi:YppG family protein [Aquibacillus kalidii]|uniref:YppG family protein n=1 Tax=Aquibacillus kalidii TaxID=2762597 RepID=UPI0016457236|nr:YppG family protein [Aquibacillus kalidii]